MQKHIARLNRKLRIRNKISGTALKPRLNVFRSNTKLHVQLIDDEASKTLVVASWKELGKDAKLNVANSAKLGEILADKALKANITEVVFDRNGYLYHGRIKALAEAARKKGLKF